MDCRVNHANVFVTLAWLDVDLVDDLDKSEEARSSGWDDLVIPDKFSGLLLSLVSNHISGVSPRQWETSTKSGPNLQIDLVRGKGRGLVVLLHGQSPTYTLRITTHVYRYSCSLRVFNFVFLPLGNENRALVDSSPTMPVVSVRLMPPNRRTAWIRKD